MENGEGGEAAGETKMAGLTNGHVNADPAAASAAGGSEVVTRSKPQVTESFRSSENIGENSSDVERFKSKVTEFSDTGDHSVANEKQYEENALKAMREKTDDSEMTSTTETRLAQRNRVETDDAGATKSHYSENQDKKHETTSQSTQQVGDMTSKMASSESSHQKSAVSIDATSDGGHAVLVDIGNDTSSKMTEEIQGDNFRGTRKVETSKSERKMEYTSHGGGGNGGGEGRSQLDLGSQFDELFGAKGEHVKRDRDKRNVSFLDDYDGGKDRMGAMREYPEDLEFLNQAPSRRHGGGGYGNVQMMEEEEDYLEAGYSSSRKGRSSKQDYLEDADTYPKSSWGLSTDRRTADDLVQRILSESRGGGAGSRSARRTYDDDRPYSPSTKSYSPSAMSYSPKYTPRGRGEEDGPYSPSPSPSAMKKDKIFKVDMGDGAMASPRFAEGEGMDLPGGPDGDHGMQLQEMPMSKKKPQRQTEEMSLLDRRLASMGFDTKLGQQVFVKKDSGNNEGYLETTYISKKKPPGTFLGQQDDDLDDEINAMRSNFHDNLQRRSRIMQEEYEDDESQSSSGGHSGGAGGAGYRSRGKMVRQQYVEDPDSFGYRPRVGTPPEDYIPDDEFVPKKRPETEEVVKEKSATIRTVIDKQSTVLEKLREASSSFDDLNNEIRNIKQQFMENQMKRTYIMQDEPEGPDDDVPPERGRGFDRGDYLGAHYAGVVRGAPEEDGYRPYIPRKQRMEMQRSRSMYDDVYSSQARGAGDADEYESYQRRDPMSYTDGPPPQRQYEPMEDEDDALGYGAQPARRGYESSTTSNYTSSATAARYLSRPTFNRANTVSDFNFDRPSSPASYVRHDRYDRPSTFSSRFLDKVRDKRTGGTIGGASVDADSSRRDRPFKSRFLRDSLTSSSSSTSSYSKSSYSARSSKAEVSSGTSGASASVEVSPGSSTDAPAPAASPTPPGGADSANTESTPAAE